MDTVKNREKLRYVARLLLIGELISFAGWCFEKVGRFVVYGAVGDRGFLWLPLCPIYGISVVSIYLLLGTPLSFRGVLGKRIRRTRLWRKSLARSKALRLSLYFVVVFFVATAIELVTGLSMKALGVTLWDYSERFLNIFGVVCLGYSVLWGALITLFMGVLWESIYAAICGIPIKITVYTAFAALGFICVDFFVRCFDAIDKL